MNNIIKGRTSEEVTIQLKRAEVQKDLLIKSIYKEYEIYFQIVRKSIFTFAKKGIFGLYSDFSNSEILLNLKDLNNFFKKNISLIINSRLPFITIEQLKLEDISYHSKQSINANDIKGLPESRKYQKINFDYDNDLACKEASEFYFNNDLNRYEYYASPSGYNLSSLNLDERYNLNFLSEYNYKKDQKIKDIDSLLELIEETNENKLNEYENIKFKESYDYLFSQNLNIFDLIDKSFNNLLSNMSYSINSELFKINLLKKLMSEDTFKSLSSNSLIIKHPYPFVFKYDSTSLDLSFNKRESSDIYLFTINNVELEFHNLDLTICRNNINELKNKFRLINKKEKYWRNKEINLNNLI